MFADGFGNARVTGLKEVTLPDPVSMMPGTMGWWILAGVLLAWLIYFGYRGVRHWQANRYRGVALTALADIERLWGQGDPKGLSRIPVVLKRTAMQAFGRKGIAELTGDAWLKFLDQTGRTTNFTQGAGQVIATLAYQKTEACSDEQAIEILLAARQWIRGHKKEKHQIVDA